MLYQAPYNQEIHCIIGYYELLQCCTKVSSAVKSKLSMQEISNFDELFCATVKMYGSYSTHLVNEF
jgi:hypothetical protein